MALDLESLEPGALIMLLPRNVIQTIEQANIAATEESRSAAMITLDQMGPHRLKGYPFIRNFSSGRMSSLAPGITWGTVAFFIGMRRTRVKADSRSSTYTRAHSVRRPVFFINGTHALLDITQCIELDLIPEPVLSRLQQNLQDLNDN